MYKIMIAEDDMTISNIIFKTLEARGFQCLNVHEFDNVTEQYVKFEPELILMDINLPGDNGFNWCEKIRAISKVPIIFISARNKDMDIITATSLGGDDYLVKPFSIEVLVAKVKGMLRRAYSYREESSNIILSGDLIFNTDNGQIQCKNNKEKLTHNEKLIP